MTNEEMQVRLADYRQFVTQISEALGVPDDSMILPYAQAMAAEVRRLRAELAAVPVDTIRAISLTEAKRLNEIDWTPIAAWFDAMDGAEVPTSGFFTSGRWDFSEA